MRILLILISLLCVCLALPALAQDKKESTYERVMRTGVLRCGYASFQPSIMIDATTGKISGIAYDLVQKMGEMLNLKIEWSAETGYGEIIEGFHTGKYDIFCAMTSPTPERAKASVFTTPLYYSAIGVWVRADDTRFDKDYRLLNNPAYLLSTKDGDLQESIADSDFPKAKKIAIPQMADASQNLLDVAAGKADATFIEPYYAGLMLAKNPGTIKNVAEKHPVRLFPNVLVLPAEEFQMKMMIDTVLNELIYRGEVEKIVEKHTGRKDAYLPVAQPYKAAE